MGSTRILYGKSLYVLIWQYRVKPGLESEFISHYGAAGSWARLFRKAPGYLGTELLRDPERSNEFVTVDRWESESLHRAFLESFRQDYAALDAECEALTASERLVGGFHPASASQQGIAAVAERLMGTLRW